jgi:hypothetical protein
VYHLQANAKQRHGREMTAAVFAVLFALALTSSAAREGRQHARNGMHCVELWDTLATRVLLVASARIGVDARAT